MLKIISDTLNLGFQLFADFSSAFDTVHPHPFIRELIDIQGKSPGSKILVLVFIK